MSRPTSKSQLLEQARMTYNALQGELAKLSATQMVEGGIIGEWSVKDVLAHLLAWQQMCLAWYREGKAGRTPVVPSEKYNWRQIPALNQAIYETHRDRPLETIRREFEASHQEVLDEIEQMTNEELFTPGVYAWTKSTILGSYFTSVTCSHYEWARTGIRRGLKAKAKQ
jgi:hypothetical protein